MDISIITVTWNNKENIKEQIESVKSACQKNSFEQILIDNGSTDGTVDFIVQNFPEVKIIINKENLGFAAANNQGARIAQGGFLLFLNPDMRLEADSLNKLIEWFRARPDVGLVGLKLTDENGNFNTCAAPRRFPTILNQLATIFFKIHRFCPSVLNNYLMKDFNTEIEQEVDSVRGSFMLARRALIEKLGWAFDPRYFIWFEDVDLCREAKLLGYKVMYTPFISAVDFVGQSFKKQDTYWKQKNFTKSMLRYFQKWEPWYKWIWLGLARGLVLPVLWLREKIKK